MGKFGYDAGDAAREFFSNCFHMKDWLKKHPGVDRNTVESFVNTSRPLSIAADIASAQKHAGLATRSPRAGAPIVAINTMLVLTLPIGMPAGTELGGIDSGGRNPRDGDSIRIDHWTGKTTLSRAAVEITVGTEKFQSYDLAKKCVAEWDQFLVQHGITFNLNE
jgi:hypothetical protein